LRLLFDGGVKPWYGAHTLRRRCFSDVMISSSDAVRYSSLFETLRSVKCEASADRPSLPVRLLSAATGACLSLSDRSVSFVHDSDFRSPEGKNLA
jgi:hypothetical protein